MSITTPAQLAKYIKGKKNVLVLAGYLCDEVEFNGKKLSDYAAEVALRLDVPVAATGNSVVALKQKGARAAKKVALGLVEMLRYKEWRDPVTASRPDLLVLIGYPREVARALVTAARGVETVVLGTSVVEEATYSLGDASLSQYQRNLEGLVKRLAA
ncbi:MAG: hypothetical protein AB1603_03995 [Chloroflexota bacterium]